MNLSDRIAEAVRAWPQWSRAELAKIELVVAEVLDHCANGTGNRFIREFVNRVIVPQFPGVLTARN